MRCKKCGAELSDDAKFCSYCGHKFEQEKPVMPPPITNNDPNTADFQRSKEVSSASPQKTANKLVEKAKGKFLVFWKGLDTFSKISSVIIAIAVLLLLIAMVAGKAVAVCISVLQISGVIVALLMHKGKIKLDEKQKFLKPIILCVTLLFTLINVWSFSWGTDDTPGNPSHIIPNTPTETQSEILSPFGASDCKGQDYTDIESKFYAAGFMHIKTEPIEDLTSDEEDKLNAVESISINNNIEFTKDQKFDENSEVLIQYHTYQKCDVTLSVDFIPNLLFSKYDVIIEVDGDEEGTLPHGKDKSFDLQLTPGEHTFSFISADSSSVSGETLIAIKGTADVELKISCTSDAIDVEIVYVEDMGAVGADEAIITKELITNKTSNYETVNQILTSAGFTNIILQPQYDVPPDSEDIGKTIDVIIDGKSDYDRGSVFAKNVDVTISYHASESDNPETIKAKEAAAALEAVFPQEMARRAVVVAMTNCQATDVFIDDANAYDPSKFHAYSDIDDFFMLVEDGGEWSAADEVTWHVDGIILKIFGYETYLKASANVKLDGDNYIVHNVDRVIAAKEYLDSDDPSKTNVEHMEPAESAPYLTVSSTLISEDRDNAAAIDKVNAKANRQTWIESQFNWWDGRHEALSDLIKQNLNDRDSFKHVDVSYIDVSDEERMNVVNTTLKDAGISERVEIGDLFVLEEFTAKNAFNATIKSTGYGIVKSDNTVILLGIA